MDPHVNPESRRVAKETIGRRLWFATFGALTAMAIVAWAIESSVLLPAGVIDRYEALKAALDAWAAAHVPSSGVPLLRTFASLALSPLLYLGLAAVLLAERLAPADPEQQPLSRGMVHDGLAWFLLNAPLTAFVYAGCLGLLYWVLDHYAPFVRLDRRLTGAVPMWMLVVAAIVVGDLLKWLHHYASHKVRFLWHFHSIHHSQRELNLFTQSRFHAVETISLVPILYTPLYVLNLNFELAVWIVLFTEWYARITHANLRTNYGPLRHALVTPQSHRIHHSRERRHVDKNFATLFSIWDHLFGTQWPDHDEYPATGIAAEDFPWEESVRGTHVLGNYFAQLIYPFRQLVKSCRRR
jgi:sterol desaturase/sphingolipid hydroxylase (fatty acid hydroxylase superfamily)